MSQTGGEPVSTQANADLPPSAANPSAAAADAPAEAPVDAPVEVTAPSPPAETSQWTLRNIATVSILIAINLLNYADRYTVAARLSDVKVFYDINDQLTGLLQTVFIVGYMITAPIFGFLGDRFNRKWIMVFGIDVWIAAVMGSTFIPADHFWAFLTLRGIVGVGEASYSVLAPTIIADIFTGTARSRVLMLFYFAIPVGAGLGFGIGSGVTRLMGDWRWGVRVTPILGAICILFLAFFVQEPERGKAEKARGSQEEERGGGFRQILQDLLYLLKNITYIWSTIGVTTVVFVVGTLAWFATLAVGHAEAARRNLEKLEENETTFIASFFGGIMTVGGILGAWKKGFLCFRACATQRADMIICAIGSAVATPFLFGGLHLFITSPAGAWVCIFVAVTALCLNWAVNMDCLLSIIVPKKRGLASAVQILISHLFGKQQGDASGPWIVGAMSDTIRGDDETPKGYYNSLLYAFYLPSVLLVVSAAAFGAAAWTFPRDRRRFEEAMGAGPQQGQQGGALHTAVEANANEQKPEIVVQPPENSAQ